MKGKNFKKDMLFERTVLLVLVLIMLALLGVYTVLKMGVPPVVGNLMAAHALRRYAAQVYPEWEPEGIWAGYNVVTDDYYLAFCDGKEKHTLEYTWPEDMVWDRTREEELLAKAEIDKAIKINALWISDRLSTNCSVCWSSRKADTPLIFVTSRFYTQPGLTEDELLEQITDVGMRAYNALSPLISIDRLSIHCGQQEIEKGITWTVLTLELEDGIPVTGDLLGAAPVAVEEILY